jgi:hypothetical protein
VPLHLGTKARTAARSAVGCEPAATDSAPTGLPGEQAARDRIPAPDLVHVARALGRAEAEQARPATEHRLGRQERGAARRVTSATFSWSWAQCTESCELLVERL